MLAGAPLHAAAQTAAADSAGPVFLEAQVDRPVEPVRFERPVFPPSLRETTVCGWANLGYIVGREGRVERASVVVLRASHPEFGRAASTAILGSVFKPALRRGEPVRQRVVQRVSFPPPSGSSVRCL